MALVNLVLLRLWFLRHLVNSGVRRACTQVQSQDGSVGRTKQAERHRRPVIDANKMAGLYGNQGSRKLVAELVAKWLDKCTQDGELLRRIMDHGSWCVILLGDWEYRAQRCRVQSAEPINKNVSQTDLRPCDSNARYQVSAGVQPL
ncbi:hypothetical protein BKA59DRAFT_458223 [Fusarium tricinctum]|uniref:Uncharacterized protein n=1 Tax=Fusarium tricinctum TaxID=61284 RepID=A0A8K0W9V8_9HYPO|nr:hypothetical protein BKA59DRAFT_458223 [Fusarium tricinctum]